MRSSSASEMSASSCDLWSNTSVNGASFVDRGDRRIEATEPSGRDSCRAKHSGSPRARGLAPFCITAAIGAAIFFSLAGPTIGVGPFVGDIWAQAQPVVGVDLDPSGNTSTSLSAVDACRSVTSGQRFDVDVFARDVPAIDGLQATLSYDPTILRPVEQDVNLFLASASGSDVVDFSKPAPNKPGEYVVAAFDFGQNAAESGSGAIIRVGFEALSQGRSPITVGDVKMVGADGEPVQPADTDGRYLGQVISGVVAVDLPCQVPTEPAPTEAREGPTAAPTLQPEAVTTPPASPQPTTEGAEAEPPSEGGFPWLLVVVAVGGVAAVGTVTVVLWRMVVRRS
jgi:hypothetical protein